MRWHQEELLKEQDFRARFRRIKQLIRKGNIKINSLAEQQWDLQQVNFLTKGKVVESNLE